jgi:hypothetical protein
VAPKYKTLKLVLKGEVAEKIYSVELDDGQIIDFDRVKKLVVPSKKNNQQIAYKKGVDDSGASTSTPMIVASASHGAWHRKHKKIFEAWRDDIINRHKIPLPIDRAKGKLLFYFPDNRERDLTNKTETLNDMMQDVGIIRKDCFQVFSPLVLDGKVQRDWPRTEIYITILLPGMPEYETDITRPSYAIKQKARKAELQKKRRLVKRSKAD